MQLGRGDFHLLLVSNKIFQILVITNNKKVSPKFKKASPPRKGKMQQRYSFLKSKQRILSEKGRRSGDNRFIIIPSSILRTEVSFYFIYYIR